MSLPLSQFNDAPPHAADAATPGDARELHNALAHCQARLQRLQQQQEAYAMGVAHDLRAPLRAIDSYAALLAGQAGTALDATAREYLQRIRTAAARLGGMVDAISELARVERAPLRLAQVDLSLLAEWACAELQDAAPTREARIEVAPDLHAYGDERLLRQLLTQVLRNAWRFTDPAQPVRIAVTGERAGENLRVRIRDGGRGFDPQYAERVFTPFARLHSAEEGAGDGLGLAIAKRIAERLGGDLQAHSAGKDQGSEFVLTLPAAEQA